MQPPQPQTENERLRMESIALRKTRELHDQVIPQRAADASVLKRHHGVFTALHPATLSDQVGVDVYLGRVVDQHSDSLPVIRVENVV